MDSRIIYMDLIIPYSCYMEPPRTNPTIKFDPLRNVVIFATISVDPCIFSTEAMSVVIGGTKKLS